LQVLSCMHGAPCACCTQVIRQVPALRVHPQNEIRKIRDPMTQLEAMGVPEKALSGHAFHTYELTSPDGTVQVVLKHNVVARGIYAEGTVDAVLFLQRKINQHTEQRIYNMVDVLKEGMLR
jgi:4-hydroxy-tetrahydrodipicolinate reductase